MIAIIAVIIITHEALLGPLGRVGVVLEDEAEDRGRVRGPARHVEGGVVLRLLISI